MSTYKEITDRVMDNSQRTAHRGLCEKLVNEAYKELCSRLRLGETSVSKTLTAGQADYSISSDLGITNLTSLRGLTYTTSTQTWPMTETTPDQIRRMRSFTIGPSDNIGNYAIYGFDLLMLYPTPESAGTLNVFYAARAQLMGSDNDTPDALPEDYHDLIELLATSRAARRTSVQLAKAYKDLFDDRMREFKRWYNHHFSDGPLKAPVGYPVGWNRRYPSNRSSYSSGMAGQL